MEGQERNTVQLERIGAMIERRWCLGGENGRNRAKMKRRDPKMALEKVRRRELCCLPSIKIVSLFFLYYFLILLCDLNV